MKYAFLIPMGEQMVPQMLFSQWVPFQEWLATNEDGKIFSLCSSNQIVGRNVLITNSNPHDPFEFLKIVEWIIWVDADIKFSLPQMQQLMSIDEPVVSGWYLSSPTNQTSLVGYFKEHPELLNPDEIQMRDEIFEVDFITQGFAKIHSSVYQQMEFPFYYSPKLNDTFVTEDITFFKNMYEQTGIKPKVVRDLKVGHIKWVPI